MKRPEEMIPALAEAERNTRSAVAPDTHRSSSFKLPFLSAILLTLAYPRVNFYWLAWIALVPFLIQLRRTHNYKQAFGIGYFFGFFFIMFSCHWIKEVTLFGLFFVCGYQGFFYGFFGMAVRSALSRCGSVFGKEDKKSCFPVFPLLAVVPALWTLMEAARINLPVLGFGWNLLAYSQASNLLVIQSAKIFGALGVSFVILFVNMAVFLTLNSRLMKTRFWAFVLGFIVFVLNVYYGGMALQQNYAGPLVNVGVVQGNIEQDQKWDLALKGLIIEKYSKLTQLANFDGPDLIVWPEAAYPGFLNKEYSASSIPELAKKISVPLLVGAPHQENETAYYNSAYLISKEGNIAERYDKIQLVPFGEYMPWKFILGFLERYAYSLGVSDFSEGKKFTVFEMPFANTGETVKFSTLICFEDIFPRLARQFVLNGANCLFVMTNDAWFGKTGAPYQHLQASVFRAIENGVPVVRAGNIGVSAFISPRGEVLDTVKNERGFETYVTGGLTRPVTFTHLPTFYQKKGFLFPLFCVGIILTCALLLYRKNPT